MDKETKKKYSVTIGCFFISLFLLSEGSGITHFGKNENDTPGFIIVLVGVIFLLAGFIIHIVKKERLNNFLASILTFIMGAIFGWISLFGNESNFSGNGALLSFITELPIGRIMFGFGSLITFLVSAIAFYMFLHPKLSNK
jgi:hypothetical protein